MLALESSGVGAFLSTRVVNSQDAYLKAQKDRYKLPKAWLPLDLEMLHFQLDALGGMISSQRHLGVAPTTIRFWVKVNRIPEWAHTLLTVLVDNKEAPMLHAARRNKNTVPFMKGYAQFSPELLASRIEDLGGNKMARKALGVTASHLYRAVRTGRTTQEVYNRMNALLSKESHDHQ
jgi:hypothetical protein